MLWPLANVAAFGINTYITFGVGASRGPTAIKQLLCPDGKTNVEISTLYPTLVTPSGWAFSIWGLIFLSEGAAVVWHCVAPDEVQKALQPISPFLCGAFLLQAAWTVAFAKNKIGISSGLLLGITGCLVGAYNASQHARSLHEEARTFGLVPASDSFRDQWLGFGSAACSYLCRFPVSVHLAWVALASMVNINMWLVKSQGKAKSQMLLASATKVLSATSLVLVSAQTKTCVLCVSSC